MRCGLSAKLECHVTVHQGLKREQKRSGTRDYFEELTHDGVIANGTSAVLDPAYRSAYTEYPNWVNINSLHYPVRNQVGIRSRQGRVVSVRVSIWSSVSFGLIAACRGKINYRL